jgi:hypothetical protein
MQMMPKTSWPQRVASDACARAPTDSDAMVIGYFLGPKFLHRRFHGDQKAETTANGNKFQNAT